MKSLDYDPDVVMLQEIHDFQPEDQPDIPPRYTKGLRTRIVRFMVFAAKQVNPDSLVRNDNSVCIGINTSMVRAIAEAARNRHKIDGKVYPYQIGEGSLPILDGVLERHAELPQDPSQPAAADITNSADPSLGEAAH